MTDLVITAANVECVPTTSPVKWGTAAEAITAGQALHKLTSDGLIYLSDADHATVAKRTVDGVAVNGAAAGQPVAYAPAGTIVNMGATLTVGEIYVLSGTAGGVAPEADLSSGEQVCIIGVGLTAANMQIICANTTAVIPA